MATTAAYAQTTQKRTSTRYSRIWKGAAEAGLSSDNVHDIVFREFKKKSLKDLTDKQVDKIGNLIWDMSKGRSTVYKPKKRTDEGGRPDTVQQRRRMYMEACKIRWSEKRVDGLAYKMYGVSSQKWLTPTECSDVIEALKDIVKREKKPCVSELISILNQLITDNTRQQTQSRSETG